jgi:hypothetical protein
MQFWVSPDVVPIPVWIIIFYLFVLGINMFGVRGYGEGESTFSIIKITAVIVFIIVGIIINCGGAPKQGAIGTTYWRDPGASIHFTKLICRCLQQWFPRNLCRLRNRSILFCWHRVGGPRSSRNCNTLLKLDLTIGKPQGSSPASYQTSVLESRIVLHHLIGNHWLKYSL